MVAAWVAGNEEAGKAYEGALRMAADDMAQETVEIADDADPENVAHAKHRTEVRLKLAGKLYRGRYGEQVQHNVTVDPFTEMLRRVSERRLAQMRELQGGGERVIEAVVVSESASAANADAGMI